MIGLAIIAVWCAIGIAGLVFDWTRDLDMGVSDAVVIVIIGSCIGPFVVFILALSWLERLPKGPVIVRKRRPK